MPVHSLYKKKKAFPSVSGESELEDSWPPTWSVSFADLTTLLMSGFILWYALTAMKIPPELLAIKEIDQVIPADIKIMENFEQAGADQSRIMLKIKALTPKQRRLVREMKALRELKETIERQITQAGLDDKVDVRVEIDAVLITPREPFLFGEGDARLKQSSFALLDTIIETIRSRSYYRIRVEGHTDSAPIGPFRKILFPTNWELSYKRAITVAQYLIAGNISPAAIGVTGYSDTKPKVVGDDPESREKNRRVDIYIYLKKVER
ncbi:MAG: flagellar motor protein MotB [Candidatus Omnitrophota bacterium]